MTRYCLYSFTDGNVVVITRGPTLDATLKHVSSSKVFPRGITIQPVDYLPINAPEIYSQNHDDGWLYRAPAYLNNHCSEES